MAKIPVRKTVRQKASSEATVENPGQHVLFGTKNAFGAALVARIEPPMQLHEA